MTDILTGVWWNLSVVLICISFMARDCKHFPGFFLAIWTSLIKFCLVQLLLLYWLIDFGGVQFLDFHVFSSLTNIIPQFVLSSALQLDNSLPSYPLLSSICLRHWALNGLSTSYIGPNTLVRCREPMLPQTTTNQTVSES
jgi:uncharacterized membrane protein